MNIIMKQIEYGTEEYEQSIDIRNRAFRIPWGMDIRNEDLSGDADMDMYVGYLNGIMIATIFLKEGDKDTAIIKSVAIEEEYRVKGLGRYLMDFIEELARKKGYTRAKLMGRVSVEGFYHKLGYKTLSEPFDYNTIPHINMEKSLLRKEGYKMELTARNHSMLFALIAKNIVTTFGKTGENAIKDAVIKYGNQRGKRMEIRAEIDGQPLDVKSYLAYGEWEALPGETDWKFTDFTPGFVMENHKCPWYDAWEEYGINEYGKLYCTVVDGALAEGFGNLDLKVLKTLSFGGDCCEFVFVENGLSDKDKKELDDLKNKLGSRAKMPWDYHIAHLYYTISEVIYEQLGDKGTEQVESALDEYGELFGQDAKDKVIRFKDTDFNIVEEYIGINQI